MIRERPEPLLRLREVVEHAHRERHVGTASQREAGDVRLDHVHRVEVPGYKKGSVKRHGCPSHGVGLTPDEKELWVVDGFNQRLHVFDATVMPPAYVASIALLVDQPGWITFSVDGRYA